MNIIGKLSEMRYRMPIFATADIADGALLMPGVTADDDATKNIGTLITASGAIADSFGVMDGLYDYSVEGSTDVYQGDAYSLHNVKPNFEATIVRIEYDQDDTAATTSAGTTTTVNVTSLEDGIDGCWLYIVSGTAIGQLRVILTDATNACTAKTAFSPNTASGDTFIKILRPFHQLGLLNTAATKMGSNAAAGGWTILVLKNYIERVGALEELNPVNHSGLSGLNATALYTKFYADIIIRNDAAHTTD